MTRLVVAKNHEKKRVAAKELQQELYKQLE